MKRTQTTILAAVVTMALAAAVLIAVSLNSRGEPASTPITLAYWTHEDPNRTPFELRLVREFEAAHPGVRIIRVTYPSTQVAESLFAAFAANQGPQIFHTQLEDSYAFVANGLVAPVSLEALGAASTRQILERYVPGSLDPVFIDDTLYGIPLELLNWSIYINDRIFRDAGLDPDRDYPRTWEDMVWLSERIVRRDDGGIITRRGFDFRYSDYLNAMVPMVEQLGGALISEDGSTAIVGEEAWIAFLHFMQQWGPHGKNLGSPAYRNARSLFNHDNDEVAMIHSGMYQQARIMADNPEFYHSGEWRVVPFPVFENARRDVASSYYAQYLMVNADATSRQQYYAWKFISYMQQHAEEYLRIRIIQPSRALMESESFLNMPYTDVFMADMDRGNVVYHAANSTRLQELIRDAVEAVMLDNVSPERAYATLKAHAQEILNSGGGS